MIQCGSFHDASACSPRDYMGRRVQKMVSTWNGTAYVNPVTTKFVYDGWNLLASWGRFLALILLIRKCGPSPSSALWLAKFESNFRARSITPSVEASNRRRNRPLYVLHSRRTYCIHEQSRSESYCSLTFCNRFF